MKKLSYSLLVTFLFLISFKSHSQNIGLGFLFRPNITLGTAIVPTQNVEDSLKFGINRFYANLVVPLSGKLKLDLKNINASFTQHFLTVNTGLRLPQGNLVEDNTKIYNFSAGITGVHANIRSGVWFYTVNGGIVQDIQKLNESSPFFTAAGAYIRVKGIYKHNIYGVALLYQYERFFPVPILGINRRYNKKWFLELLLPAQGAMRYQFSKNFKAGVLVGLGSFRAGVNSSTSITLPSLTSGGKGNLNLNYTELKITSVSELKIKNGIFLSSEIGVSTARSLSFLRTSDNEISFGASTVPYGAINLHIDLQKSKTSPISSRLFGNDF
ncbi:DUF6268 family outer membrane beta-barrel protein [Bernardetia sp. Wsw4-3y2]|uniref:DUF6268 family outer membrane beta-barrel protein n=1 Tax=Bernardetia sp. Wsw4-3y2 TaxID=3127471 RepID=UPI0030D24780